jgi:hypothetical protein
MLSLNCKNVQHVKIRPSLVSIGRVVSEEKIFEKVYDVRRTPSDGNSSDGFWRKKGQN